MADRFSSKTFQDLILALAEDPACGLASFGTAGNETAQIPSNQADLDRCKRIVNRGYQRFLNHDPAWSFLRDELTITFSADGTGPSCVAGENWRYRLPGGARSTPLGNLRYLDQNATVNAIGTVEPRLILDARQQNDTGGTPTWCGFRPIPLSDADDDGGSFEMIVWPSPDSAYVVTGSFRLLPYDLVTLDERHIAGSAHDNAIIACVLYEWAKSDKPGDPIFATLQAEMIDALQKSVTLDRRNRPSRRGQVSDGGRDLEVAERMNVTHIDGAQLPSG